MIQIALYPTTGENIRYVEVQNTVVEFMVTDPVFPYNKNDVEIPAANVPKIPGLSKIYGTRYFQVLKRVTHDEDRPLQGIVQEGNSLIVFYMTAEYIKDHLYPGIKKRTEEDNVKRLSEGKHPYKIFDNWKEWLEKTYPLCETYEELVLEVKPLMAELNG